jgi:hypothetical protein
MRQGGIHRASLTLRRHCPKQRAATGQESGKGCGVVIHCPTVECVPVDGLERRTGELQRFRSRRRYFDQFKRARGKLDPRPLRAVTGMRCQAEQRRQHGCGHNRLSRKAIHSGDRSGLPRRLFFGTEVHLGAGRHAPTAALSAKIHESLHCFRRFDPNILTKSIPPANQSLDIGKSTAASSRQWAQQRPLMSRSGLDRDS